MSFGQCGQFNADSYILLIEFGRVWNIFYDLVFEVGTYLRKIALHAEFRDFEIEFLAPFEVNLSHSAWYWVRWSKIIAPNIKPSQ